MEFQWLKTIKLDFDSEKWNSIFENKIASNDLAQAHNTNTQGEYIHFIQIQRIDTIAELWYFKMLFVSVEGPTRAHNVDHRIQKHLLRSSMDMMRHSIFHASHTHISYFFLHFPFAFRHIRCRPLCHTRLSMFCYLSKMCVNAFSIFFFACNQIVLYEYNIIIVFGESRGW